MCEPCNVLQSGPRFDFLQLFFSFGTYASRNRPCRPVLYGPMQRLCHPAHLLSFCCKSKLFNSKKIANLKSQIPSLAFHSEQHANAQTTLPLYFPLRILCKAPLL